MVEKARAIDPSHLAVIRDRLKTVFAVHQSYPAEIHPGAITDWEQLQPVRLRHLSDYLHSIVSHTLPIRGSLSDGEVEQMNPKESFFHHLGIMGIYVDVLWENERFQHYCDGLSREFLQSLVLLHDFSRTIVNGSLPYGYVDGINNVVHKLLPNFPRHYLHSIEWFTGQKSPPAGDLDIYHPDARPSAISLMLKAIDSLAKVEADGTLRDPALFFHPGNGYDHWLAKQVDEQRFPFPVMRRENGQRMRHDVTATSYAMFDRSLALRGVVVIEAITGASFEQFRVQAQERNTLTNPASLHAPSIV